MSEVALRRLLTAQGRRAGAHVCNVENGIETGTPDQFWSYQGRQWWWELKVWDSHTVRLPHFEGQQVAWLGAAARTSCPVAVFLRARRTYLLLPLGTAVRLRTASRPLTEVRRLSYWYSVGTLDLVACMNTWLDLIERGLQYDPERDC